MTATRRWRSLTVGAGLAAVTGATVGVVALSVPAVAGGTAVKITPQPASGVHVARTTDWAPQAQPGYGVSAPATSTWTPDPQ